MRLTRAGSVLLTLGVFVGVAACIGLILGFEPARLPAALLNIAAYKLTFVAAGGLLAAGAILLRYARREATGAGQARDSRERDQSDGGGTEAAASPSDLRQPDRAGLTPDAKRGSLHRR